MSSAISHAVPLELLAEGERGVVIEVEGRSNLIVRLEEMGLHAGARIRMIQAGSPCILEIHDQRYSLRFDDSVTVLVEVGR